MFCIFSCMHYIVVPQQNRKVEQLVNKTALYPCEGHSTQAKAGESINQYPHQYPQNCSIDQPTLNRALVWIQKPVGASLKFSGEHHTASLGPLSAHILRIWGKFWTGAGSSHTSPLWISLVRVERFMPVRPFLAPWFLQKVWDVLGSPRNRAAWPLTSMDNKSLPSCSLSKRASMPKSTRNVPSIIEKNAYLPHLIKSCCLKSWSKSVIGKDNINNWHKTLIYYIMIYTVFGMDIR